MADECGRGRCGEREHEGNVVLAIGLIELLRLLAFGPLGAINVVRVQLFVLLLLLLGAILPHLLLFSGEALPLLADRLG